MLCRSLQLYFCPISIICKQIKRNPNISSRRYVSGSACGCGAFVLINKQAIDQLVLGWCLMRRSIISRQCLLLTTTSQFNPERNHRSRNSKSSAFMVSTLQQYSTNPSIVQSKKTLQATIVLTPRSHPIWPTAGENLLFMKNLKRRLRESVMRKGEGESNISSISFSVSFRLGSQRSLSDLQDYSEKISLYLYFSSSNIIMEIFLNDLRSYSSSPSSDTAFDIWQGMAGPSSKLSALSISQSTSLSRKVMSRAMLIFYLKDVIFLRLLSFL